METPASNTESKERRAGYERLHQVAFFIALGASSFFLAYGASSTISFLEILAREAQVTLRIIDVFLIAVDFLKFALLTVPVAVLSFFKGFNIVRPRLYKTLYYISWLPASAFVFIMVRDFADPAIQLFGQIGLYAFLGFPLDILIAVLNALPFFIGLYFYKRVYQELPSLATAADAVAPPPPD